MAKVSICCPCYNSEKYIKETVASFVNQSFEDIEIVISDDCSTDNTYNVISSNFNDNRIRLFKQKQNLGPSLNSEFVVNQSTTEYLSMCAGDDVMHIDRVKKCYEFMQQNPSCDMVYTFTQTIDENSNDSIENVFNQTKTPSEMLRHFFDNGNFICGTSIMIKKDVYRKLKFNPCLLQLQDFDMWARMLLNDFKIMCLPEKLTKYRVHGENLSLSKTNKNAIGSRTTFEYTKVLLNFVQHIKTPQKFEDIFQIKVPKKELIPFFIAQQSLSVKNRVHFLFALDVIYNEMLNDEKRKLINEYCNFEMKDFYKLCSNFNENKPNKSVLFKIKREFRRILGLKL
jgi:glycosyltransferase involved in cell wall biosynthesis